MASGITIGQLARAASVNIQTVRYYERRNLLTTSVRSSSGYRLYSNEELSRLRFIKRAQASGFTLKEITELLNLRVKMAMPCAEVQHKAQDKLAMIESKIKHLQAMARTVRHLVHLCETDQATSQCPILESWAAVEGKTRRRTKERT